MMQKLRNQKGIAMLMALMTMTVLGILIAELVYQTEVYHRVVFGQVDQLRSKYLAKAGLKLAILQLHGAKKAKDKIKSLGDGAGSGVNNSLADKIWQTPLILPPPIPKSTSETDKSAINAFVESLELNGRIAISISGESQKLNLNQLIWLNENAGVSAAAAKANGVQGGTVVGGASTTNPEEELKTTRQLFLETIDALLQNKKQEDESFRERYQNLTGEVLLGNLLAWMDPNTLLDGENRNKEEYYSQLSTPYSPKNAPLSSLSELYMVRGFDDDLVSLFSENFTTLITNGININSLTVTLLRSLIPTLSPTDAEKVIQRRTDPALGGPFQNADDFWTYLNTFGNFDETKKELEKKGIIFTTEDTAYRVIIEASSGYAKKSWVAYIGSAPPEIKKTPTQTNAPAIDTKPKETQSPGTTKSDNKPPIIIYLKAE